MKKLEQGFSDSIMNRRWKKDVKGKLSWGTVSLENMKWTGKEDKVKKNWVMKKRTLLVSLDC